MNCYPAAVIEQGPLTLQQALSYIHREILTGIYLLGAFWPASYGLDFLQATPALSTLWAASCTAMSIFTLLPANKVENLSQMYVILLRASCGVLIYG